MLSKILIIYMMAVFMQNTDASETNDERTNQLMWMATNSLTQENDWRIVNDDVMGGVSNSQVKVNAHSVSFSGTLSMENNGGFASAVFLGLQRMSESDKGFAVRVKGDGRTYQLRFNMQGQYSGVSYRVSFPTNGEVQQLYFPFTEFDPVYRGRVVYGAPELNPEKINRLRFLIADKKTLPFDLEILGLGHLANK